MGSSPDEGFFEPQGLDVEVLCGMVHDRCGPGKTASRGTGAPQDIPFLDKEQVIADACAWGSVCNAGMRMGRFVPETSTFPDTRSLSGRSLRS